MSGTASTNVSASAANVHIDLGGQSEAQLAAQCAALLPPPSAPVLITDIVNALPIESLSATVRAKYAQILFDGPDPAGDEAIWSDHCRRQELEFVVRQDQSF